jgi:hypothetical protein
VGLLEHVLVGVDQLIDGVGFLVLGHGTLRGGCRDEEEKSADERI